MAGHGGRDTSCRRKRAFDDEALERREVLRRTFKYEISGRDELAESDLCGQFGLKTPRKIEPFQVSGGEPEPQVDPGRAMSVSVDG